VGRTGRRVGRAILGQAVTAAHPLRGHLYWVRIPGESRRKRRPALVLSVDVRNRLAADVIVAPLSTNLRPAPTHVRLRKGEGGLVRASMVKAEQITTLPKDRLSDKPFGGPLSPLRLIQVEKAVLAAVGVVTD